MVRKVFQVQVIKCNSGWDAHRGKVYDVRDIRNRNMDDLYQLLVTERNTTNMDEVCRKAPHQVEYRDNIYKSGRACIPKEMAVRVVMNNEGSLCNLKEDEYAGN
ncbi:hypothetical protein_gp141 [Bacillus phage vB_BceM_WH1]|nr:hypothetical protein_gp141 [Bacillus phage vB_BceM_WH1]